MRVRAPSEARLEETGWFWIAAATSSATVPVRGRPEEAGAEGAWGLVRVSGPPWPWVLVAMESGAGGAALEACWPPLAACAAPPAFAAYRVRGWGGVCAAPPVFAAYRVRGGGGGVSAVVVG